MTEMDVLQVYSNLTLLIVATSLLAILGLRVLTASPVHQVELIREFRASLELTSRNCMHARSVALASEFQAYDDGAFGRGANAVPLASKQLVGRHYVEESDRLIRALASLTLGNEDMQGSQLRRRLKELKRVQRESVQLLSALETGRN